MKKIYSILSILTLICLSSCKNISGQDSEALDTYFTEEFNQDMIFDNHAIVVPNTEFYAGYEIQGLSAVRMVEFTYNYDSRYFTFEEIDVYSSDKSMFTVNYDNLTKEKIYTSIDINASCYEIGFNKTYTQEVVIYPYYRYFGQIFHKQCNNSFDSVKQDGENGFKIHFQSISSGHIYNNCYYTLDMKNYNFKLEIFYFHKDVYGTHDEKEYCLNYYFDESPRLEGNLESKERIAYEYYIGKLNEIFIKYNDFQFYHENYEFIETK